MKKIFLGFIISICFIFSIVLTACKINNAYIEYKVEHYLENIDNNEYTLFETEVLKGKKNKGKNIRKKVVNSSLLKSRLDHIHLCLDIHGNWFQDPCRYKNL